MADQNFPPLLDLPPAPPPANEPGRPSIRDLLDQDKRALEGALTNPNKEMTPERRDELREFYQRFTPPVPGVFLSQPVRVAALPEALAQILSIPPEEQALTAARALSSQPRESFSSYLSSVPLEQAREMQRAFEEQQLERDMEMARAQAFSNLVSAPPPALFDYSEIDAMIADQLAAERAAVEEQDQIAAMNDLASAFGIGMETTPEMGRQGMVAAWDPYNADDWAPAVYAEEEAVPESMSTPFGVAMGTLGQNVDANPMSGQFSPMSQHQTAAFAEEDPFGDDPFNAATPAFSVAPSLATVPPDAFANAQAALAARADQQLAEQDAYGEMEGNRGRAFSLLSEPEPETQNMISFVSPRVADMLAFAKEIQETDALLNEIARAREQFTRTLDETEQQITEAEQQASLMSQLDEQALDDAYSARNQAQVGALAPNALQSAIAAQAAFPADPFGSLTSDDFGVSEADPNSTSVGAVGLTPSAAAASLTASNLTGDPFGAFSDAAPGINPAAPTMSTSDITGAMGTESDDSDGTSASVGPSIGSTLSASIGSLTDSFAAPADTTSAATDVSGVDAAASDSEGDSDSDNGGGDGLGGLGGLGLSGVDAAADVSAPSDTGDAGAAGAGDAGAGAAGDSGAGGSDAGAGGGGAGTGSGTGSDPSAWATGGRVKGKSKGLGARLKSGKSKGKSRGLAAMPG